MFFVAYMEIMLTGLFTSIAFVYFACFEWKTGEVNVTFSHSQDSASISHLVLAARSLKVETVSLR